MPLGIIFSLIALVSWGFSVYFSQKSVRIIGLWKSIFFLGLFGFIVLLPFVAKDLSLLFVEPRNLYILLLVAVVALFSSMLGYAALKVGKIAIIEPINGIELPITVGLSVILAQEHLGSRQAMLIGLIFLGIVLAITRQGSHLHYHRRIFEKGVILAGLCAIGLALTNFLVGVSSQQTSPLLTIWFINTLFAVCALVYLTLANQFPSLVRDFKENPKIILLQSSLDFFGWLAFAVATTLIGISISTAISESYIALGVLLGIILNKEKLRKHQFFGIALVIVCVIILSSLTK